MNRRNFIKKLSRTVVLGGVIAGSGYLLLKPKTGEACNFDFICKNCKELKSCSLAEAEAYKEENIKNQ